MGYPTLTKLLDEYSDIFAAPRASDRIKNFKAKLTMKDDAKPKFLKARPLPYAIRSRVDTELDLMEKTVVITKIEHSDWASPLVVIPKPDGRVRITGDFKSTVNAQLCVTQYPIASPDDIFTTISGGNTFTKLDGTNAYRQLEVARECRKYLVINTRRELYQYSVLPRGIASSQVIFQEFADTMLRGLEMAAAYIDDIASTAKTDSEHISTLRQIFDRMRKYSFKLSKSKCQFLRESIEFLGHKVSKHGTETTPAKVHDIVNLRAPTNVTELKSFHGLVLFYQKFLPDLSTTFSPQYKLAQKEVPWKWSRSCQLAIEEVKKKLITAPILAHFDPKLQIRLSCDARSTGASAILYNVYPYGTERPISFASRLFSQTEQRYSQIQ